jgi:hypothetical protein
MTLYPTSAPETSYDEFSNRLASIVNLERMAARGDPGRTANLIERQIHCLAYTLALCVPASKIGDILGGVETAIYESVAEFSNLTAFVPHVSPNMEP